MNSSVSPDRPPVFPGCLFEFVTLMITPYDVFSYPSLPDIFRCPAASFFVYAVFKVRTRLRAANGDEGIRTLDPLLARQVLSQLSYTPELMEK